MWSWIVVVYCFHSHTQPLDDHVNWWETYSTHSWPDNFFPQLQLKAKPGSALSSRATEVQNWIRRCTWSAQVDFEWLGTWSTIIIMEEHRGRWTCVITLKGELHWPTTSDMPSCCCPSTSLVTVQCTSCHSSRPWWFKNEEGDWDGWGLSAIHSGRGAYKNYSEYVCL